jgi:heptosyltransferase-3
MEQEFRNIKKILVIKLRHIGDVLLTVPVFRALRESFPHAHIAALVNSGTEDVLTGNPLIDDIITFDRGIKKANIVQKYFREMSFIKKMRMKKFDMSIDLTSGDRAAIISFASGARYRLAYDPDRNGFLGKRFLYTHLAKKDGSNHMVIQNLDIVKQFGIGTDNLRVDLFIPEDARIFVKMIFDENNIHENDKTVHVHPAARWLFKCWKDEYMADVINWLLGNGNTVIATSSSDKKEMEKSKRILSLVGLQVADYKSRLIDLCGKTTLKQLAAISAASGLFLGVDSAPMHIAAAAGTPVVALFGPTGEAQWGPWGDNHTILTKKMRCISCEEGICDSVEVRKCLEAITPEEVIDALKQTLHLKGFLYAGK